MENYGISKYSWLKEFLELPNGIPSDDTFRRVFVRAASPKEKRINPEELERVLNKWLQQFLGSLVGEVLPIDGKNLRGELGETPAAKTLDFALESQTVLLQASEHFAQFRPWQLPKHCQ